MSNVLHSLGTVAKALVSGVVAGGSTYVAVSSDGVTGTEWVGVSVAFLAALGITYAVPNKAPNARHRKA